MTVPAAPSPIDPAAAAAGDSPVARLLREPHRFGFHQAVRLLERWIDAAELPPDDRPALRFCNSVSLSFPASEIAGLDVDASARDAAPDDLRPDPGAWRRIRMTPAFMSLLGAGGALPLAYSEQFIAREVQQRDGAARAFLDIFLHRAVSLFHQAWLKYRLPLHFEADRRNRYLPLALSLAGLGQPALRDRLEAGRGGVADDTLAFYAGLLQRRTTSALHLQRVLADYFGVPVRIEQFVGRWFRLDRDNQSALGDRNMALGRDAVVGERVWQRDLRVRVVLGPLDAAQQHRFLPGRPGQLALQRLLALAGGNGLDHEVRLCLRADAVSPTRLASVLSAEAAGHGSMLGWNTFLLAQPSPGVREESAYDLHALA